MIEQICKTKGKYLEDQYSNIDKAEEDILNQFPEYAPSIKSCKKEPKNFVNEVMRFSVNQDTPHNRVSLLWLHKFLEYILKCATKAMNMISKFFKNAFKVLISESEQHNHNSHSSNDDDSDKEGLWNQIKGQLPNWKGMVAKAPIIAGSSAVIFSTLGLTAAVILIAIGLWLKASGRVVTKLKSNPGLFELLKRKTKKFFGSEDEDIPDDLQPPDIDVPNISLGNIQQQMSESMASHMIDRVKITVSELVIKACFLLCLKAVLSFYMCEALATTLTILAALFVPGLNLITYILLWIYIGLCAIIRRFRKEKVTMGYENGTAKEN